ncbi:MAG: alpha/beta hydrolase fold domain-containing protein [Paracoccaceae bacterium]
MSSACRSANPKPPKRIRAIADEVIAKVQTLRWKVSSVTTDGARVSDVLASEIGFPESDLKNPRSVRLFVGSSEWVTSYFRSEAEVLVSGQRYLWVTDGTELPHVTGLGTSRFYRARYNGGSIKWHRIDWDKPTPLLDSVGVSRVELEPSISSILSVRRIMMRNRSNADPAQIRDAQNRWVTEFAGDMQAGVRVVDLDPYIKRFEPAGGGSSDYVYIHGGGMMYYGLDNFAPFLTQMAAKTGARVTAIGYDLAPEHDVNTSLDVLLARVKTVCAKMQGAKIIGDSVGGLIALFAALEIGKPNIDGVSLIYPVLALKQIYPSTELFGEGYLLDDLDMRRFRDLYKDWFLSKGFDPMNLPLDALSELEVYVFSAGVDVLADEAAIFADRHKVKHRRFGRMPHDFCLYSGSDPGAQGVCHEIFSSLAASFGRSDAS